MDQRLSDPSVPLLLRDLFSVKFTTQGVAFHFWTPSATRRFYLQKFTVLGVALHFWIRPRDPGLAFAGARDTYELQRLHSAAQQNQTRGTGASG